MAVALPYDRAVLVEVLVYHQRRDLQHCMCGWGELGASHPEHVADVYEQCVKAAKREQLVDFALWISNVWDPENGDDRESAEAAVDAFLRGETND